MKYSLKDALASNFCCRYLLAAVVISFREKTSHIREEKAAEIAFCVKNRGRKTS